MCSSDLVAANRACGHALSLQLKAVEQWRTAGEEVLLDATGLLLLLVQVLYLAALMLDALRVIDRHRDMAGRAFRISICARGKASTSWCDAPNTPMIRSRTLKGMMTSERV